MKEPNEPTTQEGQPEFAIQRIYVKDFSLEAPNSPQVFLEEWEPDLNMDLSTNANALGNGDYEVALRVTVTVKMKEKVAFLVEVEQAGIFTLVGFPEEELRPMLGAFCPNIIYPYAREAVTDAVIRAGFPQLYLAPVNFEALYEQQEREGGEGGNVQLGSDKESVH